MIDRSYEIKARKTNYGGVLFRSRIEARWAVFLDSLGVEYDYEPFYEEVGNDYVYYNYMPDFYLPKQEKFIEVKPGKPTVVEERKAAFWCKDIQDIVILFNLNPPTDKLENGWLYHFPSIKKVPMVMENYWWGECRKCGHIDISEYAYVTSCGCYNIDYYNKVWEKEEIGSQEYSKSFSRSKRLMKAYLTAKKYNFNPGLNPRVIMVKYQSSLF